MKTRYGALAAIVWAVVPAGMVSADVDLGALGSASALPAAVIQLDPVYLNGRIYVTGGWDGTQAVDTVMYAELDANGQLGPWNTTLSLPDVDQGPGVTAYRNSLYAAFHDGRIFQGTVNPDGSIAAWNLLATAAPDHGGRLSLEAHDGFLYLMGGWDGSGMFADVFFAPIDSNGSIGSWTSTTSMPQNRQHTSVHFFGQRTYIAGGITCNCCDDCILDSCYSAPVNADGSLGAWRQEPSLPHPLWLHNSLLVDGEIYLIGGRSGYSGGAVNVVYRGTIHPTDGTVSAWEVVADLSTPATDRVGAVYAPVAGGVAFLIGGYDLNTGEFSDQVLFTLDCPTDVTGLYGEPDGITNFLDLIEILADWGPCGE